MSVRVSWPSAALSGLRFGKHQCGGGQAHLPHRLADCLRRCSGLAGKAADLADGMLIGCGMGDEVQVPVIQVRYPERVLPVLERGPGREYLSCVALQRGDPGLDRVLSQPQGTLLRCEDRIGNGPGTRSRVELVLGPQVRDVAQGDRDLPPVPRSVYSVTMSGDSSASSVTESSAELIAAWARISNLRLTRSSAEGITTWSR